MKIESIAQILEMIDEIKNPFMVDDVLHQLVDKKLYGEVEYTRNNVHALLNSLAQSSYLIRTADGYISKMNKDALKDLDLIQSTYQESLSSLNEEKLRYGDREIVNKCDSGVILGSIIKSQKTFFTLADILHIIVHHRFDLHDGYDKKSVQEMIDEMYQAGKLIRVGDYEYINRSSTVF